MTGPGPLTLAGAATTAYMAGLRHAFDADHLCGIDNAARKFVGEGRRPVSVGLAFSLGHSSVVFLVSIAVAAGISVVSDILTQDNVTSAALGTIGGLVAGGFLLLIGLFNLVSLTRSNSRHHTDGDGERATTVVSRLMSAPLQKVSYPSHLFVVGFAFGLGFDTATLIGLLVLTATAAASGIAVVSVLALPVCFAAAMTLGDTFNGLFMLRLYARANDPRQASRRLNVAITSLSVLTALTVAAIVLVATLREAAGWADPVTKWIAALDLEIVGYAVLAVFAVAAIGSLSAARHRRESV
ncbi:HoxN/HupN/NixA family nickel/cobalt transporter [Nocardia sp. NPDC052566]|uniref:HoxN/HupN/NixA family nickel/cobalt transporter n=1 Tax=Nocardia sp. NPDC052566 TaxID=3364330 RepID=UPI0037CB5CF8